jgi:predicted transcriptional regulator
VSKSAVITARIEPEKLDALETLAGRLGRSRAWVISEAITAYLLEQTAFLEFVQEGIDDLDNDRWTNHEDLVAMIRERRAKRRAA